MTSSADGSLAVIAPRNSPAGAGDTAVFVQRAGQWSDIPAAGNASGVIADPRGQLVIYGENSVASESDASMIAQRVNNEWRTLGNGIKRPSALSISPSGNLLMSGDFHLANGDPVSFLAELRGGSWHQLGDGLNGPVVAMARLPDGNVVACGNFNASGNMPLNGIGRWDGTSWHAIGNGFFTQEELTFGSLFVSRDGTLLAGYTYRLPSGWSASDVARWDGNHWIPMGGHLDGPVVSMAQMADGSIVAVWRWSDSSNGVVRWAGQSWEPMNDGLPGRLSADARIVYTTNEGITWLGGVFRVNEPIYYTTAVMQWDGSRWSPTGYVPLYNTSLLTQTPDGTLIMSGDNPLYHRDFPAEGSSFYAWNGTDWKSLGDAARGRIESIVWLPDGTAYASGNLNTRRVGTVHLARVDYTGELPVITVGPSDLSVQPCTRADFTVTASSSTPLQYKWEYRFQADPPDAWRGFEPDVDYHYDTNLMITVVGDDSDSLSMGVPYQSRLDPDALQIRCTVRNQCNSVSSAPVRIISCISDINCDGGVDGADLAECVSRWEGGYLDLNEDGATDIEDLHLFLEHWEQGC